MVKSIYDYIAKNSYVDIQNIADSLNLRDIDVLNTVNALTKSGHLGISVYSLIGNRRISCYYYATKKYLA